MRQTVLILSGLPGSGKTTSGIFFQKKAIPVIRIGSLTDQYLKNLHLSQNESNENTARIRLREKYGDDIYARQATVQALRTLKKHKLVVIEGMRSLVEFNFFNKTFTNIFKIFIETDKVARYKRLRERRIRGLSLEEINKRDEYEIRVLRINKLKRYADFIVPNNYTKGDLYKYLNKVLGNILNDSIKN